MTNHASKSLYRSLTLLLSTVLLFGAYFSPVSAYAATAPKLYRYLATTNKCYSPFDKNEKREYNALKNYLSFATLEECLAQIKKPEPPKNPPAENNTSNQNNNSNNNSSNDGNNNQNSENQNPPVQKTVDKILFYLFTNGGGADPRCLFVSSTSNNQSNISCCSFPFSLNNNDNRGNIKAAC